MSSSRLQTYSWAFYDWANSAFATTVMAGFFPIFFKQYWAGDLATSESTFLLGTANSVASLVVVVLAPVLGAIADRGGAKKRFLIFFAAMGIVMTGSLFLVAQGHWSLAVTLYILAMIGFAGGNVFYDALLVEVADEQEVDMVSALGYGLGYLGGGLLFSVNVLTTLHPEWFGLAGPAEAVRWSFLSVAIWWALFSIPVMLLVEEKSDEQRPSWLASVKGGLRQLSTTLGKIRTLRVTFLFLLAYWLYIDGVDTIVRMAVDYGLSIGFDANNLMLALLITQFIGFPAALVFGRLGNRWGAKRGILLAIGIYLLVITWAYGMSSTWEFYALAAAIGLVQGGIQALSRSLYTRLIPRDQAGEFFGFYNMLGKFAAVLGPVLMAWVGVLSGSPRVSILSVTVLFLAGGLLLYLVDEEKGQRMARSLEGTH